MNAQIDRITKWMNLATDVQRRVLVVAETLVPDFALEADTIQARDGFTAERERLEDETIAAFMYVSINVDALLANSIKAMDDLLAVFAAGERIAADALAGRGAEA